MKQHDFADQLTREEQADLAAWLRECEHELEHGTNNEPDTQKGFWADEDYWVDDDGVLRAPWESDDE